MYVCTESEAFGERELFQVAELLAEPIEVLMEFVCITSWLLLPTLKGTTSELS